MDIRSQEGIHVNQEDLRRRYNATLTRFQYFF